MNSKLQIKVSEILSEIYQILRMLEVNKRDIFKIFIFLQYQVYDVPTDKKEEFELVMLQEMKALIDRFKRLHGVFHEIDADFTKPIDSELKFNLFDIETIKKLCTSMDVQAGYLGSQVVSDIEDEVYILQVRARNGEQEFDSVLKQIDDLAKLKDIINELVEKAFEVTSYIESFLEFDIILDDEETA